MPKIIQVKDTEILVALSFWALAPVITIMIGFVMSGIQATGDNKNMVSAATTMVDGLDYGSANLLFLGATLVMTLFCYSYFRYAIRLQEREVPTAFTWLYFINYVSLAILLVFPHVKLHLDPYDYGIHYIASQIFLTFSIGWMGYFSRWFKSTGRICLVTALALSAVLLVTSWGLAAALDEKSAAPAEWSCFGILMGCYSIIVFTCERDKYMKLNSNGFSNHVSENPQEYEQM